MYVLLNQGIALQDKKNFLLMTNKCILEMEVCLKSMMSEVLKLHWLDKC